MIIQSHWSKPSRWEKQHGSLSNMLYMYAASAYALKQNQKVPVGMVTDSAFAAILKDLPMPYDFITTDLDELSGINPVWWAYPKFLISDKYGPQFEWLIQCDTDVFFWERMDLGSHVDLLVQSVEDKHFFSHSYRIPVGFVDGVLRNIGAPAEWNGSTDYAFNCGVVGFKDGSMAQDYARKGMYICAKMTPFVDAFHDAVPAEKRLGSIMVVPEQYFLACYAKYRQLYVTFIASEKTKDGKVMNYDPKDYYHAMASKRDPDIRTIWQGMVKEKQPALYAAIQKTAYAGL